MNTINFFFIDVSFTTILILISYLTLLPTKPKKKEIFVLFLCSYIFYLVIFRNTYFLVYPGTMIFFLGYTYLQTKNIIMSITYPFLCILLVLFGDYVAYVILSSIFPTSYNDPPLSIWLSGSLLSWVISFGVGILIGHIINKEIYLPKIKFNLFYKIILVFFESTIILLIVFMMILIGNLKDKLNIFTVAYGLLIVSFICLTIVFFAVFKNKKSQKEIVHKNIQLEELGMYTTNLETLYTEMRIFRHDYINMLLSMKGHIENNDFTALKNIFDKKILPISESMNSNNDKLGHLHYIQIPELKGLIAYKLMQAQEKQIRVDIEVIDCIKHISIDILDLCKSIGVLLDNAMEAAIECEVPTLKCAIFSKDNSVVFLITNSFVNLIPYPAKIFEKGFSTKGKNRGLGLYNFKNILDKYSNITIDTSIESGMFTQEFMISTSKEF